MAIALRAADYTARGIANFASHSLIASFNMSRLIFIFVIILYAHHAIAAECPADFIFAPEHTLLVADTCPTGYVPAGQVTACPSSEPCVIVCPIGYLLKTGTGPFAALSPNPMPSPTLRISDGTNSCWTELVPGNAENSINIIQDGQIYHTVK